MKSLILVRHAKSSWSSPDLRDFDRPLNDRGERDAPAMGERLAGRGLAIDAIVSSPAVRAMTTARTLAGCLGWDPDRVRLEPAIYEADPLELLDVVKAFPGGESSVVLVGHNPGFSELAGRLARGGVGNMPTCAMAFIDLDIDSWSDADFGSGSLMDYDYPKKS